MKFNSNLILLVAAFFFSSNLQAGKKSSELDYASLEKDYYNLVDNQTYKPFAKKEKQIAKTSVEDLINNKVKRKEREMALYMAKHNIAYARLIAEEQWLQSQIEQEEETAHNLEVDISKTEAEIARHDAELARLMLIAQQEEAKRAYDRANEAEKLAEQSQKEADLAKQQTEAAKRYAEAQAEEADLAKQEAELALEELESLKRKLNSIASKQTDKGLVMTLGDFVFDSGKSSIKQQAIDNFSKVVEFINTHPDKKVRIEGHTDSSGSAKLNLRLSQERAEAVKALLIKNRIEAKQLEAVGMGEDFPVAENTTEDGKAKNRRVEIIILQ